MDKDNDEGILDSLLQQMDWYLKRNSDRELLCLEPIADEKVLENTKHCKRSDLNQPPILISISLFDKHVYSMLLKLLLAPFQLL